MGWDFRKRGKYDETDKGSMQGLCAVVGILP